MGAISRVERRAGQAPLSVVFVKSGFDVAKNLGLIGALVLVLTKSR